MLWTNSVDPTHANPTPTSVGIEEKKLLDTIIVDAYMLHVDTSAEADQIPKIHLDFLLGVVQLLADSKNTSRQKQQLIQ